MSIKSKTSQQSVNVLTDDKDTDTIFRDLGVGVDLPFVVGEKYFIRATFHLTGRLKAIRGPFLVLEQAAWIAQSGRFADCIAGKIEPAEVEPVEEAFVNINDICDAMPWPHPLPRKQK